ncbi:MAG: hypothetical protein IT486_01545 [Gammaproteobacteria bacterium]|nr:hypothetical protein [Gammaproteobacteria bacterium]
MTAALCAATAAGGAREQAKRMHDRLAGVPPTAATLDAMAADISGGNALNAALTAVEAPSFYNVTLKNFAAPWTNRDQSVFVPLNDYTATVIGMVRDDVPFNTLLSANMVYVGAGGLGLPAYSMTNNAHYQALEDQGLDLKANLVQTAQTSVTDLPVNAVAGVVTTRAAAEAFFVAGTNRAMFRFTVLNHLCKDLEELKDTSLPVDRIRQDIPRSPGGDSRIYMNNCSGCHTGMDPMAQAYAYYNFDATAGRLVYTAGQVQPKYLINADNFRPGYVTPNDHWDNYWRHGQNRLLGWASAGPGSTGSGDGAQSLGVELANSDAYARCQVQKVFRNVCLRDPVDGADRAELDTMVTSFKGNGYRLKRVFAEAAVYCKGD